MNLKLKIIRTDDGSPSLYHEALKETYHSTHGAMQESQHVYIDEGFYKMSSKDPMNILEIGFGTGLNALLTALEAMKQGIQVFYTSLEPYPISDSIWNELHYDATNNETFKALHEAPWDKGFQPINDYFHLLKMQKGILNTESQQTFNLIYFDAFAPSKQPEMWEIPVFKKIDTCCLPGSILVTYSATGSFRRILKALDWSIEKVPGPPGKREMTRAVKMG